MMKKIIDNLFVGNWFDSYILNLKNDDGIVAVVNCTRDVPNYYEGKGIEYIKLWLSENDAITQEMADRVISFIDGWRKRGGVLVHCNAGMQRSPSIAILYLMSIGNSMECSVSIVRRKVGSIEPTDVMLNSISAIKLDAKEDGRYCGASMLGRFKRVLHFSRS